MLANKSITRKRRREICQNCGKNFSHSWFKEHKWGCKQKKFKADHLPSSTETFEDEINSDNYSDHQSPNDYENDEVPSQAEMQIVIEKTVPRNKSELLENKIVEAGFPLTRRNAYLTHEI